MSPDWGGVWHQLPELDSWLHRSSPFSLGIFRPCLNHDLGSVSYVPYMMVCVFLLRGWSSQSDWWFLVVEKPLINPSWLQGGWTPNQQRIYRHKPPRNLSQPWTMAPLVRWFTELEMVNVHSAMLVCQRVTIVGNHDCTEVSWIYVDQQSNAHKVYRWCLIDVSLSFVPLDSPPFECLARDQTLLENLRFFDEFPNFRISHPFWMPICRGIAHWHVWFPQGNSFITQFHLCFGASTQ